jgi:hypothetical protein
MTTRWTYRKIDWDLLEVLVALSLIGSGHANWKQK